MQRLYKAIEEKLGDKYPILYQNMSNDTPNTVGIFLYESSNDLETLDGSLMYESIKVHIQVNAENTEKGIFDALDYLRQFVKRIENERSAIVGVSLVACSHVGPKAIVIGKNEFNVTVCVSNVDVKYRLKD